MEPEAAPADGSRNVTVIQRPGLREEREREGEEGGEGRRSRSPRSEVTGRRSCRLFSHPENKGSKVNLQHGTETATQPARDIGSAQSQSFSFAANLWKSVYSPLVCVATVIQPS